MSALSAAAAQTGLQGVISDALLNAGKATEAIIMMREPLRPHQGGPLITGKD